MLCDVMLMLCYVMLNGMLVLCYVMLCHDMWCYVALCYVNANVNADVMLCYVNVMLWYAMYVIVYFMFDVMLC